jgi:hypothetical protein
MGETLCPSNFKDKIQTFAFFPPNFTPLCQATSRRKEAKDLHLPNSTPLFQVSDFNDKEAKYLHLPNSIPLCQVTWS